MNKKYYICIIECEKWKYNRGYKEFIFDKTVYQTGLTDDPKKRLFEHKNGIRSIWMMTRNIKPLHFVYIEEINNYYLALKRRKQIKQLSLKNKLKLLNNYGN